MRFARGFGYGSAYTTIDVGGGGGYESRWKHLADTTAGVFGQVGIASVGLRYGMVGIGRPLPNHQVLLMFDLLGVVQVLDDSVVADRRMS